MTMLDAKRNYVVDTAAELFLQRSLSAVTVRDIAGACGLGEATIYRYFAGKQELVVACALKLQAETERMFAAHNAERAVGYKALETFYRVFPEVFRERPQLYRFLSDFDAYCQRENIQSLDEYADNMDRFKAAFITAYERGVQEGSVRKVPNVDLFYYTSTHAILSLCKRLATEDGMLRQDRAIDKGAEIETLVNIVLFSLKAAI